jgi:hypothetical protein
MPSGPLSLSKERVRERSSEDFNDSLKVPVAQQNSKRPLPPLAMLARPLLGQGEVKSPTARVFA